MATYSIFSANFGSFPFEWKELAEHNVVPAFVWALGVIKGFPLKEGSTSVQCDREIVARYETKRYNRVVLLSADKKISGNVYDKKLGTFSTIQYTDLDDAIAMWLCLIGAYEYSSSEAMEDAASLCIEMKGRNWKEFEKEVTDDAGYNTRVEERIVSFYIAIQGAILGNKIISGKVPIFGALKNLENNKRDELFDMAHSSSPSVLADKLCDSEYNLVALKGIKLDDEEKARVPKKEDWFIMPDEGYEIMDEIVNSMDLRNYWLIGKAGTGKTELAKQIAANLGLPYVFVNCGSGFDDAKIRGQFIPNPDAEEPVDSELLSYVNSLTDSDFILDAETVANKIGAKSSSLSDIISRITEIKGKGAGNRPEFLWQDSPIVYAYSRPCVCEVQEADCIRDPGVLTNFNSILECGEEKFIQLDNGKMLRKNPYCIYIFTSNMQYEGCRMINNAVFDRLDPYRLELPSAAIRAKRVMKRTGFDNKSVMRRMVNVVDKIDKYLTENGLTTGVCGMRSLEHWAEALMIWQKKHPGEEIPEDVLEKTGARKVLAKTAQPEDELDDVSKVWYGLFSHDE